MRDTLQGTLCVPTGADGLACKSEFLQERVGVETND